jgi:hypothetical protein
LLLVVIVDEAFLCRLFNAVERLRQTLLQLLSFDETGSTLSEASAALRERCRAERAFS